MILNPQRFYAQAASMERHRRRQAVIIALGIATFVGYSAGFLVGRFA